MTTDKQLTPIGQICQTLDKMQSTFVDDLKGTGISEVRFLATAKIAVQTHADRDRLAKADRQSLYLSIRRAASDGLMPDGREAALVVYGDKVQYQPMVQGLFKLAFNSGEIDNIGAYVVYSNDTFTYRAGIDTLPSHEANWFSDRGDPIGIWAFVKLKSGNVIGPVMLTKERIDRIATRSKMAVNYDPKKGKDWEEFWKKAIIRNILKYAPRSSALDRALEADTDEFELNESGAYETPEQAPVSDKPKTQTRAAKAVKKIEETVDVVDADFTEENSVGEEDVPV